VLDGFTSTPSGSFPGDTVLYSSRTEPIDVTVGGGPVSGGSVDESGALRDDLINIETVIGGQGNDEISRISSSLSHFVGGLGNDTLTGAFGTDLLEGGPGVDTLDGADGNDELIGGTERDLLTGGIGDDDLEGEDGNDDLAGGDGVDELLGAAGTDNLDGGIGNDDLDGSGGTDQLIGGFGADLINGGAGTDRASYADRITAVTAIIGAPGGSGNADDGLAGARDTIATDVENLRGGTAGDTLTGNGAANEIDGGAGTGADTLKGGHGADDVIGGDGNDVLLTRDASADDALCGGGANDRADVDGSDVPTQCETVNVG
jgi:Ca2+-binding RTX toxin-like protein